jgi:exosome complex RNA-binding protein Rrp4
MFKEDVDDRSSFNDVGDVVNLEDQQVAMSISVELTTTESGLLYLMFKS